MSTPLHEAVKAADVDRVKELVTAGADPNAVDADGRPPLYYSLRFAIGFVFPDYSRQIIETLLAAGADPDVGGAREYLLESARATVSSALEANEARDLRKLLGDSSRPDEEVDESERLEEALRKAMKDQ